MDSDGELQDARNGVANTKEDEMNKLRSNSVSPSTFSTASSGSPLVRGSSSGSSGFSNIIANGVSNNKRPAPTSIAAAQLQQQQQLEFTNKLLIEKQKVGMSNKKNSTKHSSASKHSSPSKIIKGLEQQQQQQQPITRVASSWSSQANNNISSPPPNYDGSKKVKSCEKIKKNKGDFNESKSFGYNVAKSIAFRAYRFNEFWSIDKMRYMNLACLLMTLVCLITILFLSSNTSSNGNPISTNLRVIPRKSLLVDEMPANAESIDSLDSQPLVGSVTSQQQQQTASANNDQNNIDNILDNFKMNLDNRKDGAKFRRKSELSNQEESSPLATFSKTSPTSTNEREIEDSNNSNIFELPEKDSSERKEKVTTTLKSELDSTNSLIDPILSQIFNDSEIGSMFKQALKRASNGTNGTGGGFNKPIIRRSKNGATIIISSSSTFNNSNGIFNDSSFPFPSLIEKLLPPMFFRQPLSLVGGDSFLKHTVDGNSSNNPEGLASSVATITINSKPVFAASSSSPFGISRFVPLNPFAPFLSAGDPFGPPSHPHSHHNHHHPHHNHHHYTSRPPGLFIKPFRGPTPFGPPSLFGSPFSGPISAGTPSLMSMIVRANQLDQADEDSTQSPSSSQIGAATTASKNEKEDSNSTLKNSDALKVQASQQHNSTTGKPAQSSSSSINNNESEVETFDMPELIPLHSPSGAAFNSRLHNFYPPRSMITKPSGSMVIFSSSDLASSPSRFADPFGPFPFGPSLANSPFSPFMSASMNPSPQMMFVGGENGPIGPNGGQMLNPILRSFLSNVMSDIVPVASVNDDQGKDTTSNNKTGGSNDRSGDGNNSSSSKVARLSSSSNLNPSWTALSSAELDDDWTNGASEGSIDRWDEQNLSPSFTSTNSNKHIRAHHRSSDENNDNSNQATENSEVFPGIQFEQHQSQPGSPFERHLESSFIGGNNFRGPSVTVEKFIEAPQASIQRVGAGIRSQSLSRADFEEPSEPTATFSRPSQPTSPFFSSRSISSPSQSMNNDDFAPHVGFISRLLNDISRRSELSTGKQNGGSSSIIKNRSMDDDFDEGDSSNMNENMLAQPNNNKHISSSASANNWPKIRVASARIRMRPFTERRVSSMSGSLVSPSSETIFMSPTHFTIAENNDNDKEGQASSIEPNKPSFDDTMNSMEDRLNHVLSLASHQTFLPNHKQQQSSANEETPQMERQNKAQSVPPPSPQPSPSPSSSQQPPQSLAQNNARAAVAHSIPLPPLVPSRSEIKHNQVEQKQQKPSSDNPFTSPSSPLFGFPTSSLAQSDLPKPPRETNNVNTNNNNSQQNYSNRQQRSFTYHSNNEVASSLSGDNTIPRADQITPAESIGRSRFIPLSGPPASVVMGRRLDDGPFSDEQSVVEQLPSLGNQQRHQQEFAVPSRGLEEQSHSTNGVTENRRSQPAFNPVLVNNIATQN